MDLSDGSHRGPAGRDGHSYAADGFERWGEKFDFQGGIGTGQVE